MTLVTVYPICGWHIKNFSTILDSAAILDTSDAEAISSIAAFNTRIPSGHPEGYLEAFANLYKNFALTLQAQLEGKEPTAEMLDFPTVSDGVRGMAFIENVIASGRSTQKWTEFKI